MSTPSGAASRPTASRASSRSSIPSPPSDAPAAAWAAVLPAPFAALGIATDGAAVTRVAYLPPTTPPVAPRDAVARRAAAEVRRYFADPAHAIDVPVRADGTDFQRRVWNAIAAIPVGESRTYGEIARLVRSSPRAVGGACGANPVAIVVPCHRVVGSRGVLGGFMNSEAEAALAIKRWLLAHEGYRFGR